MVEQELVSAITKLLDEKFAAQEKSLEEKLAIHKAEVLNGVKVLLEADVSKEIKLIYEHVLLIREKQLDPERVDDLEDDVDVLKAAVKTHSREIRELKKAL